MGFQELNGLDADVTISLGGVNRKTGKPNPVKVEGYYLGKKMCANVNCRATVPAHRQWCPVCGGMKFVRAIYGKTK